MQADDFLIYIYIISTFYAFYTIAQFYTTPVTDTTKMQQANRLPVLRREGFLRKRKTTRHFRLAGSFPPSMKKAWGTLGVDK